MKNKLTEALSKLEKIEPKQEVKKLELSPAQKELKESMLRRASQVDTSKFKTQFDLSKAYERALQEGINDINPDGHWTDKVKGDIMATLLESNNNLDETVDKLLTEASKDVVDKFKSLGLSAGKYYHLDPYQTKLVGGKSTSNWWRSRGENRFYRQLTQSQGSPAWLGNFDVENSNPEELTKQQASDAVNQGKAIYKVNKQGKLVSKSGRGNFEPLTANQIKAAKKDTKFIGGLATKDPAKVGNRANKGQSNTTATYQRLRNDDQYSGINSKKAKNRQELYSLLNDRNSLSKKWDINHNQRIINNAQKDIDYAQKEIEKFKKEAEANKPQIDNYNSKIAELTGKNRKKNESYLTEGIKPMPALSETNVDQIKQSLTQTVEFLKKLRSKASDKLRKFLNQPKNEKINKFIVAVARKYNDALSACFQSYPICRRSLIKYMNDGLKQGEKVTDLLSIFQQVNGKIDNLYAIIKQKPGGALIQEMNGDEYDPGFGHSGHVDAQAANRSKRTVNPKIADKYFAKWMKLLDESLRESISSQDIGKIVEGMVLSYNYQDEEFDLHCKFQFIGTDDNGDYVFRPLNEDAEEMVEIEIDLSGNDYGDGMLHYSDDEFLDTSDYWSICRTLYDESVEEDQSSGKTDLSAYQKWVDKDMEKYGHISKLTQGKLTKANLQVKKKDNDSYEVIQKEKSKSEKLEEDTVKQGDSWVNKGKAGTHGKFKTKKGADAQRKAMFANGYKEGLDEELSDDEVLKRLKSGMTLGASLGI